MMITIIPENGLLEEERAHSRRLPNSYLCGVLEKDYGSDVFYVDDYYGGVFESEAVEEGIYPCICDRDYCMLYIWNTSEGQHALVAKTTDDVANQYAKDKYFLKTHIL